MKNDLSFDSIAESIITNKKFEKLNLETHHGMSRMDHSMKVARSVYNISKKLKLDYESATRAAILHDFFTNEELCGIKGFSELVVHPSIALANAKSEFPINEIEANAIESHMFPASLKFPKYKESWILSLVDKTISTKELLQYKFSYTKVTNKVTNRLNLVGLCAFYILTMGRK
jgi:uncharacterized protein